VDKVLVTIGEPSGTDIVWQLPTNICNGLWWGIILIVKGLGVGRTDRSGEGGPPSGIPPLYSVFRGGLNRGSMPRLKFFQKKSEKRVFTPKSDLKIFQKFLGIMSIYIKIIS